MHSVNLCTSSFYACLLRWRDSSNLHPLWLCQEYTPSSTSSIIPSKHACSVSKPWSSLLEDKLHQSLAVIFLTYYSYAINVFILASISKGQCLDSKKFIWQWNFQAPEEGIDDCLLVCLLAKQPTGTSLIKLCSLVSVNSYAYLENRTWMKFGFRWWNDCRGTQSIWFSCYNLYWKNWTGHRSKEVFLISK